MESSIRRKFPKIIMLLLIITIIIAHEADAAILTKKLGNEQVSIFVEENEEVTMKFTEKIGFKFKNWTIEEGNIDDIDTSLQEINFYMPNTNVTIRANYDENYNITFDNNGGNGSIPKLEVPIGGSKVLPQNTTMTKDGYTLKGWAESEDGDAVYFEGESIMPTQDMTLYAVWLKEHPVLLSGQSWYKGSTGRADITKITFIDSVDEATLTGIKEKWAASDDKQITAYLFNDNTVIIAGNGKGKICADPYSAYAFSSFSKVTEISGLEYLDTSDVTNMKGMFYECNALTTLDLSKFNTKNVTTMNRMFFNCYSLGSLDVSKFNTSNVTDTNRMFYSCRGLTTLNVSNFITIKVTDMGQMFYGCAGLQTLDLSKFDTQNVTDMNRMFYECLNLIELDLSKFDTADVTDMCCMFYNCNKLERLELSNFETRNVKDMRSMFHKCSSLTALDLSNFVTNNVTDMQRMFNACTNLKSLDLSGFNTANVKLMNEMFLDCTSLIALDVSNFNTGNVTDMKQMFYNCNVDALDVSTFNTSNVTSMNHMFYGCSRLATLDISGFDTTNVSDMGQMFDNCDASEFTVYVKDEAQKTLIESIENFPNTATVVIKGNEYLVMYNSAGGIDGPIREIKTPGVNVTLSYNVPTKAGYAFTRWNTQIDGSGTSYSVGSTYDLDKNIVLYAIWQPIQVGEYIEYTPTLETATISNQYTGYNNGQGEQTFDIDKTMKWKLYKDNNGQLDIISADSVADLHLGNAEGYANSVYILNTLCSQYINEYADSAVSIGSTKEWIEGPIGTADIETSKNNSIGIIDITEATGYPLTYAATKDLTNTYPYQDNYHSLMPRDSSYNLIEVLRCSTEVWTPTRRMEIKDTTSMFELRIINPNGTIRYDDFCSDNNGTVFWDSDSNYGVRPVVSLNSAIRIIGGLGTEENPYRLGHDTSVNIINYNANGGNGAPVAQIKNVDDSLTLSSKIPTRSGYIFLGWNTKSDGSGENYEAGYEYSEKEDVTLYAKWTSNTCTVTFDANNNLLYGLDNIWDVNGGAMIYDVWEKSVTVTASQDDGWGITNGRVDLVAGKEYEFSCEISGTWGEGSGEQEAYLLLNGENNTSYHMESNENYVFTPTVTGTYWLRLDVNANGSTENFHTIKIVEKLANKTVTYGGTYGELPTPTRAGYTFNGWSNVREVGTYTLDGGAENYINETILDDVKPGETYTITMDSAVLNSGTATMFSITIYDFTTEEVLLSYDEHGLGNNISSNIPAPESVVEGNDVRILIYVGQRGSTAGNNITFSNIRVGKTGMTTATQYTADSTVTTAGNHTLYAIWRPL